MARTIRIALFRNDLRIHDNPMLQAAVNGADELLPLYCFDPRQVDLTALNGNAEDLQVGPFEPARTWHFGFPRNQKFKAKFLVESVLDLQKELLRVKSDLLIRFGAPDFVIGKLVEHLRQGTSAANVELFCQREQTFEEMRMEDTLKKFKLTLTDGGSTMVHPGDFPFTPKDCPKVFTSFRKKVEGLRPMVRDLLPTPTSLPPLPLNAGKFMEFHDDPKFFGQIADLEANFDPRSTIPYVGGASSGLERLKNYCSPSGPLFTYKKTRNALTGLDGSSHFSPFLSVGAISARQIFWAARDAEDRREGGGNEDSYWLVFELLWRDYWKFLARGPMDDDMLFALYGMKSAPGKKHHPEKGSTEWSQDMELFKRWKDGTTGIPFIDANMRELAATGYMSNRGRQNVGNFLAGQMCMDWRLGAEWFESCLVDHDVCSNYGNWTYTAGVGTDPRAGRNFNILKQANDYDADAEYVKLWCRELAKVPEEYMHHPWTWTEGTLEYPEQPILMRPEWAKFLGKGSKGNGHAQQSSGRPGKGRGRGRGGKKGGQGGRRRGDKAVKYALARDGL